LAVVWIPGVSALSSRDRSSSGDDEPGRTQRASGVRDRAAGRHQIVNDQQMPGGCGELRPLGIGRELAGAGQAALGGRERRGVRPAGGEVQHRRYPRRRPGPGQHPGGADRQPLDVLAAAPPGHSGGRGHRHQPDRSGRPAEQLLDRCGERSREHLGEIPATTLLVCEQAGPHGPGVGGGHGERRQPHGRGIGAVPTRAAQRPLAPRTQRPAGAGASDAAARQGQVGKEGDHAATVASGTSRRKSRPPICGQPFGLWTAS
jgi:hypothetical protein